MPVAAKRPCAKRGCGQLVARGERFCMAHTGRPRRTPKPEGAIIYGGRWRAESKAFLAEPGNAWCRACNGMAQCVDHVVAHKGDEELFWDQANWQPLCNPCHSKKTTSEDGGFGNPRSRKAHENAKALGVPGAREGEGGLDRSG